MRWIYLVVHPEATHHVDRVVGGWHDSALTERGRAHASAIGARLHELVPERQPVEIYSSDLRRTVETAVVLADVFGVQPALLSGLREKSYGEAGGRPQRWLDERFVPPPPTGERLDHDEGIVGAETKLTWVRRVYDAMDQVLASRCEHQIVVTHGGSASWVIGAWIGLPLEATSHAAFRTSTGSITLLHEDDRFHNRAVVSLSDTEHLTD